MTSLGALFVACWWLTTAARGSGATALSVPVEPHSCTVVELPEQHLAGTPLHVATGAPLGGGAGRGPRAGCRPADFRVSGLEGAATRTSCGHLYVLELDAALARVTTRPAGMPAGGALLTIESSCAEAAVLTLAFSSRGGISGWRRRMLQTGLMEATNLVSPGSNSSTGGDPGASPPGPGLITNGSRTDGDKYTPIKQLPVPAANGTMMPTANGTIPDSPILGNATTNTTANATTERMACCCRYVAGVLPYSPSTYSAPTCCCGRYRLCCGGNSVLSRICGDRSTCGVMLIVVAVVCVFVISVCIMGGFCWKRRRQSRPSSNVEMQGPQPGRRSRSALDAECEAIMALPPDKQDELAVLPAAGEVLGTRVDCSICLDSYEVSEANWRLFPCHHGACSGCTADLVKFSRQRVPDHKRIVQCPLCRELFIVPHSVLPEEVVALTTAPPPAPRASLESRRSSQRSQQLALVAPAAVASPSPVMSPAPLV